MAHRAESKRVKPATAPVIIDLQDPPGQVVSRIDPETGIHFVTCDLCATKIELTISANTHKLLQHRNTAKCNSKAQKIIPSGRVPAVHHRTQTSSSAGLSVGRNPNEHLAQTWALAGPAVLPASGSTRPIGDTTPKPDYYRTHAASGSATPMGDTTPRPDYHRTHVRNESIGNITEGFASLLTTSIGRKANPQELKPCPGVSIEWTPGSHWMTYPYLQHGVRSVGWEPISFGADNTIQFRSEKCRKEVLMNNNAPCISCQGLPSSSSLLRFMDRAQNALPQTPWKYLTADQQVAIMKKMAQTNKDLRTQINNAKRSKAVAHRKISEHRRIMMLLATNDIPGLRRMLTVLARHGENPRSIRATLQRAVDGTFKARGGFNARDMDISFLTKAIGGPRLLYALQKSHGLASLSTVRRYTKVPKLVPSIGIPSHEEISKNISRFLDPEIKPPPIPLGGIISGNILMFDGIALETKCRYCPDRNAILGLCREHSNRVNTSVDSLESVENVRQALQKDLKDPGKVCFGSDATVVAVAPYAQTDHYTPVPTVVSPSDKTEKVPELALWMKQGEKLHGPIWALGSDGDASYRLAKHLICMVKEVDRQSPLGKCVHSLLGMNCFPSKDGQLSTGDPKHIFKRMSPSACIHTGSTSPTIGDATLLRNSGSIRVGKANIRPHDIVHHLAALPEITLEKAKILLDPGDKQNVLKTVSLVQHLDKLRSQPMPLSPSDIQTRKNINFFSEVLDHFVLPFITVEMSLSDQVQSLATYAFLAAALEIKHGSFCFTGPLYSDSQAVIKNIIFTIARMQIINPDLKFYIILEGTDRLEGVFGDCRTQDHARNFDIEQLAGKLGVGALINAAFQRNPDLDRGHRRLSLSGALGIDHVNPTSWIGNARVGDVDIPKRWEAGECAANALLEKRFGPSGRVDFRRIFSKDGYDLLRPMGKYVGLDQKHEDKRSEEENETELFPADQIQDNDDSDRPGVASPEEIQSLQDSLSDQEYQDMPLGMDLDQFFPDEHSNEDDSTTENIPAAFSKVLEAEGKKYLKSSLVASLSSNRSKKATMWTLRVRGVAIEDLHSRKCEDFDPSDPDDNDLLKSGDLVCTLLHTEGQICLGIVMVKGIRVGTDKSIRTAVSFSDRGDPEYKAKVVGQLLEMRNPRIKGDDSQPADFWEWTGNYLCLDVTAGEERETRQMFVLEIPGVLVDLLGPSVSKPVGTNVSPHLPTWSIPTDQLTEMMENAWQSLDPLGKNIAANVAQLVEVMNPNFLPYRDALGKASLVVEDVPEHLTRSKLRAKDKIPSPLIDHRNSKM
ncbi:hypothetical protein B0H13DRAFT_1851287 [Mycena leptocephala]|nr:hypothetical protein B0H13DRAFT_1851287 [Mycena leptocephala]